MKTKVLGVLTGLGLLIAAGPAFAGVSFQFSFSDHWGDHGYREARAYEPAPYPAYWHGHRWARHARPIVVQPVVVQRVVAAPVPWGADCPPPAAPPVRGYAQPGW